MTTFHVADSPPIPADDERTQFYWDAVAAGRLDLLQCGDCGHFVHYPRPVCDQCRSQNLAPSTISGNGTLYSYCEVVTASHPYYTARLPYLIGIIDIDEEPGIRIPTGLVDCAFDELRCGIGMEVVFREATPTLTLPYFRPQGASS